MNGDSGLAKTIDVFFKVAVIYRFRSWRSFGAIQLASLDLHDWLNNRRLLKPTDNIRPVEAEAASHAALMKSDVAA